MGWKLFQLTIFVSVIFSNIRYEWAHGTSSYAVALVAFAAAWLATALIFAIRHWHASLRTWIYGNPQRPL